MTIFIPTWLVAAVVYGGLGIVAMGLLWAAIEVADKLASNAMAFSKAKRAWVRFMLTGRRPLIEINALREYVDYRMHDITQKLAELEQRMEEVMRRAQ